MPACRNLEPSRSQADDLADPKLPGSDNGPINAGVVFVHADHGLHDVGVGFGGVRVKIDHHATLVPHGDADGRTRPLGAKFKDFADPSIFPRRAERPWCRSLDSAGNDEYRGRGRLRARVAWSGDHATTRGLALALLASKH